MTERAAREPSMVQPPVRLFALATGVIVQGLYVAQPLVGDIAATLRLPAVLVSGVATLALLGYALGLFLLVPLCDLLESRRLVLGTLAINALALLAAALPLPAPAFLGASLLAGMSATAIQMLIPMAAAMTSEAQRGRVIGNITGGMMLGIMLARPLASLIGGWLGWRASYAALAIAVALLMLLLARAMPRLPPLQRVRYRTLLASLLHLWRAEPVLRRHAILVALCFGAFSAFWCLVALRLAAAPFDMGAGGIALFALAGVSGALSAPLAGRLGDAGKAGAASHAAHACVVVAMLLAWFGGRLPATPGLGLVALVVAAVLLDAGTIGALTLGRREVNLLRPEARGRINGLYTGVFFLGGAAGSALAGLAWARAGWAGVCWLGLALGLAALVHGMRPARGYASAVPACGNSTSV